MRIAGYIRESPGSDGGATAYLQSELIRRYVADAGHHLVALCQDSPQPGHSLGRDGYLTLLAAISSDQVDAVVVADLTAFSPDKVVQEVYLRDILERGVTVLTVDDADRQQLTEPTTDPTRALVRMVLQRVAEYRREVLQADPAAAPLPATGPAPEPQTPVVATPRRKTGVEYSDVVVELLPPEARASR